MSHAYTHTPTHTRIHTPLCHTHTHTPMSHAYTHTHTTLNLLSDSSSSFSCWNSLLISRSLLLSKYSLSSSLSFRLLSSSSSSTQRLQFRYATLGGQIHKL